MEDEIGEGEKKYKIEEEQGGERQEKGKEEVVEEDDNMELEVRNTVSVFSELSDLSRDYVESVDRGSSVRGKLIKKSCLKSFSTNMVHVLNIHLKQGLN